MAFPVMAILFIAQAFLEFRHPGVIEGDRDPIKVVCALQATLAAATATIRLLRGGRVARDKATRAVTGLFLWWCVSAATNGQDSQKFLMAAYWYALYLFFRLEVESDKHRGQWFVSLIALAPPLWLLAELNGVDETMAVVRITEGSRVPSQLGYFAVALVPFVVLLRAYWVRVGALAIIAITAAYSLKRGTWLALVLMAAAAMAARLWKRRGRLEGRQRLLGSAALIVIATGAFASIIAANREAAERRARAETGRSELYATTLRRIAESDATEWLMGHQWSGFDGNWRDDPHNDWLLLQYDHGVVGVAAMAAVYVTLAKCLLNGWRRGSRYIKALGATMILMACIQMYSMGLEVKLFGYVMAGVGMAVGLMRSETSARSSAADTRGLVVRVGADDTSPRRRIPSVCAGSA